MDKAKAKKVLHWIGFIAAIAASIYVAFIAKELTILQRFFLAGSTLGALFVGLGKLLPTLDKAVDDLPDDKPSGPGPTGPLAAAVFVLLVSSAAYAQTVPQYGGCLADGKVCMGPSATITVGQLNLTTSKFTGGVIPGVGYGATLAPSQWYAAGIALYAAFRVGQGQPNQVTPALMLSFANYVRFGVGMAITENGDALDQQWLLMFGLGSDFGGSPSYVRQQLKAARPKLAEGEF